MITLHEAVSLIQSDSRVFIHGSAASPIALMRALAERAGELRNVELVGITNLGDTPLTDARFKDSF